MLNYDGEAKMIRSTVRGMCGAIAMAFLGGVTVAGDASAGEKGKFRGLAVLTNVTFQQIKAGDHPNGAVMMGEMDGLVFNDARQPWLDKAHYQVFWKGEGNGAGDCLKVFTMPDGKLFARCAGKATANGWEGVIEVTGGTGAYTGIRGKGTYKLTTVSERVTWDVLEWDWEKP